MTGKDTVNIDKRPYAPRNMARHSRKPVGALILIAFLVIDSMHLHLLHHLLGAASGAVAYLLFAVAVAWGGWRLTRRAQANSEQ